MSTTTRVLNRNSNVGSNSNGGDLNYKHIQNISSEAWVIKHNLGKRPVVSTYDTDGNEIEGIVKHVDVNNLIVYFSISFPGTADLN